jgi:hypothetical protein
LLAFGDRDADGHHPHHERVDGGKHKQNAAPAIDNVIVQPWPSLIALGSRVDERHHAVPSFQACAR